MADQEKLVQAIFAAVDALNDQLPKGVRVAKSLEAPLYGQGGHLESIDLVNLIIEVEEKVKDAFDVSITIADDRAVSSRNSPFVTLGALTNHVSELIRNHDN